MDEEKKQSLLKKHLPKVITLNKKAIVVSVLIVCVLLGMIFVNALSKASRGSRPSVSKKKKSVGVGDLVSVDKSFFASLPAGYQDGAKIKALLGSAEHNEIMNLKQQLSQLLASQNSLRERISALSTQKKPARVPASNNQQLTAAMTAPIFYPGFSPVKQTNQEKQRAAAAAKSTEDQKQNAYGSQNMQNDKIGFLNKKSSDKIYNPHSVQYPKSKYVLQAGSFLPAILQMSLNSNLPGPVLARVSRDVYDSSGAFVVVPQGSKLIGSYNSKLSYGQNSLQIKFSRLVLPDMRSLVLDNQLAVNEKGQSGLSGSVNNHTGRMLAAAALSAVFTLPQIIAQNQMNAGTSSCGGLGQPACHMPEYSMRSAGLSAIGNTGSQIASSLAGRTSNLQPTVTINKGYEFSIFVSKDIILPPYSAKEARSHEILHF